MSNLKELHATMANAGTQQRPITNLLDENTRLRIIASAFRDIINAAGNGEPYRPDELTGDVFDKALDALATITGLD
jgi:hypothetical protein